MLHQEALLPGHLIQQFVKERLVDLQGRLKEILLREATDKASVRFDDPGLVERSFVKASSYVDVGKRMEYLLATGNLVSKSGMGLSQTSGFTIVAEKLNFLRYLSHFRSIHRGAYFQELRTTTASLTPFQLTRPRSRAHTRRFANCCPTPGAFSAPSTRPTARHAACSTTWRRPAA